MFLEKFFKGKVLTSTMSISSSDLPVAFIKPSTAGTGPIPIMAGSHPVNGGIRRVVITLVIQSKHSSLIVY